MKETIIVLLILIIGLSGCTQSSNKQTYTVDNCNYYNDYGYDEMKRFCEKKCGGYEHFNSLNCKEDQLLTCICK